MSPLIDCNKLLILRVYFVYPPKISSPPSADETVTCSSALLTKVVDVADSQMVHHKFVIENDI